MINFEKDYVLEHDKIILRPLVQEDFEALLEYSVNEPEIWKYNAFGANGKENLKKYIDNALSARQKNLEYAFVVIDKATDKIIGSTRFYAINSIYNTLEIGYTWYGSTYQGTFVNKICKYLLLRLAFEDLGFERVGFKANKENHRSINAMKSIGCTLEGCLRNFALDADNKRIDVAVLSITKADWTEFVNQNLKQKIDILLA